MVVMAGISLALSEVDRICALINELLAFARPAPAQLARLDLNDCLEGICLLLDSQARNRGVQLKKKLKSSLRSMVADEDQVKQVVMNVVLNAIQACSEGGTVDVASYENVIDEKAYVYRIADTGRGIGRLARASSIPFSPRAVTALAGVHRPPDRHPPWRVHRREERGRPRGGVRHQHAGGPTRQRPESVLGRGFADPWLGSRSSIPAGARLPPCARARPHTTSWCARASTLGRALVIADALQRSRRARHAARARGSRRYCAVDRREPVPPSFEDGANVAC
jgi:hypothetical protein